MNLSGLYLPVNACSLLQGLKERNPHTYQHSLRVAEYAVHVANLISDNPNVTIQAYMAGLLHDVGKQLIPKEVLEAPRALTAEEKLLVDLHAANGANMLLDTDEYVRDAILHHHTNYSDLPYDNVLACILKVCDVYDALTTPRCYKPALSRKDSLSIMMKGVGPEFEPKCFNALCAVSAYVNNIYAGNV